MPIADDPSRQDGRLLLDEDGRPLARFLALRRDGRPLADLLAPEEGVPLEFVVAAIQRELRGWRVAGGEELGRALVAAGAQPSRHAHLRSRDLRRDPPPPEWAHPPLPPGVRIEPFTLADDLADVYARAYPPEHADWTFQPPPANPERELADIAGGRIAGPLLPASRIAYDVHSRSAGALIVTELPGDPPYAGPWIAELFRRPGGDLRGLGRGLLQAGLAAAAAEGLATVGLAVSNGNPAERLYEQLRFERVWSGFSVLV